MKLGSLSFTRFALVAATLLGATTAFAGEHLLGYVKSAEPLPKGAQELYVFTTMRDDKGAGSYQAFDYLVEYERGVTDRFTFGTGLKLMSLDTSGLLIEGYLPQEKDFSLKTSGLELEAMYNFLSPAKDNFGLSVATGLEYLWIDPHSGQDKDTLSLELDLLMQKYYLEGQLTWFGNFGFEGTYAKRAEIAGLPEDFEWPTGPEMEIELKAGTGVSYRFATSWSVGAEILYETEFETEVGQERWSVFAGPSLHYGSKDWWATLTYLDQLDGGGETYPGQTSGLHLIEKTKKEIRLKLGFNF